MFIETLGENEWIDLEEDFRFFFILLVDNNIHEIKVIINQLD